MTTSKLGIYIHIPFCVQRCNYCDFRSFGGVSASGQERYIDALCQEIREYRNESDLETEDVSVDKYRVDSIFFGGGTPSLLEPQLIARVMKELRSVFCMCEDAEITLEANPGTLDAEKLNAYREMGINRLSMGVQSMDDEVLRFLGRIHDRKTVLENYEQARLAGFDNINLDLMFGIPGQSYESWVATVMEVLSLRPEHLSFYSLQIEEGTAFYEWFVSGSMEQPSQELDRRMYHSALELLKERDYRHYEISNAAKEGYSCRHNLKYWSMADYLGLGLSAHSCVRGVRYFNTSDMSDYLAGDRLEEVHRNDRADSISDYLFTELRKIDGILLKDFELRFGDPLLELFGAEIQRFLEEGLLVLEEGARATGGERLRYTDKGLDYTNTVLRELMTAGGVHE